MKGEPLVDVRIVFSVSLYWETEYRIASGTPFPVNGKGIYEETV